MRVLVTGGAGYIGSHAVRALARRGYGVVIYDNLSTGHASMVRGFELVVGDIRDEEKQRETLRGVDAVMHFAAHAYVGESVRYPRKYFDNNVQGGLSLLNAMMDAGIRIVIFSSTCAVYGVPKEIPITENSPGEPVNPYGASKLFFEHALEAYDRAYGLRFASLRYFNAAGADPSGEIGEFHEPETHLIPCALRVAAGLQPALDIYGEDYPTEDGTCVRDYIHVNDLAEAHVRALEYLSAGGASAVLNLGTGKGHSVKEVISVVEHLAGHPIATQMSNRRPGDPPILVADPTRAQQLLRWKASSSLREIVASAWKWQQACLRR